MHKIERLWVLNEVCFFEKIESNTLRSYIAVDYVLLVYVIYCVQSLQNYVGAFPGVETASNIQKVLESLAV